MTTLAKFNEIKEHMAQNILNAKKYALQLKETEIADQLDLVYTTLIRDQFEVIVVGEFSNGKSTFINALLRNQILPASNVPTTALINKITYAPMENYRLQYDNGRSEQITYDEFVQYVAEDKQIVDGKLGGLFAKLKEKFNAVNHIQIGYPAPLCQNNVVIIDSPGTNDMDERRIKITDEYIPKSDAAIFVLNAMRIFTASEKAFLQRILDADIQKIFFVINFKDYIKSPEEFAEIESVVRSNLPALMESPKIYFVSSLHALNHHLKEGRQETAQPTTRRAQRKQMSVLPIEQTGMPELEYALQHFLTYERGVEKLRKPLERSTRLLETIIEERIMFEQKSLNNAIENIDQYVEKINRELNQVEGELNSHLNRWRREMQEQSKGIVKAYDDALRQVSAIASNELMEGINYGDDPEVIKTNIDMATGKLEKELNQNLKKSLDSLLESVLAEAENHLQSNLSNLSNNVLDLSKARERWGGQIKRRKNKVSEAAGAASIGAGVLGGFLILASAGAIGWGLAAAGLAGGAVTKYIEHESDNSLYGRLEKQVEKRYVNAIPKRRKEVENQIAKVTNDIMEAIKKHILDKIKQERHKAQILINNHSLEADKQNEKLKQLNMQQLVGESLINNLYKEFEQFQREGGVVHDEPSLS